MKTELEIFRNGREFILEIVNKLSNDQLNEVPEGFTGNIIWHLGHMVVTHRGLVYQLGGHRSGMEKEFLLKYVRGAKPEEKTSDEEIEFIKRRLIEQADEFETDLEAAAFPDEYREFKTMTGYTIKDKAGAIAFSNFHQATHVGYILCLRRLVE
ncbi:MAG: DinB family protein [Flavobacteriales bacterium]|nr:DinB family protein [Flavobacteriales bacterium]